jgi:hypothetical protein
MSYPTYPRDKNYVYQYVKSDQTYTIKDNDSEYAQTVHALAIVTGIDHKTFEYIGGYYKDTNHVYIRSWMNE